MRSTDVTTAPGAFADVAALRACWHPVAFGRDLAGRPVHADLLGEPLVLWRGPDGKPRANSDLCVHRGTALSLGWVEGENVLIDGHLGIHSTFGDLGRITFEVVRDGIGDDGRFSGSDTLLSR